MVKKLDAYLRLERGVVDGYRLHSEIPLSTDTLLIGRYSKSEVHVHGTRVIKVNDDYVSRGHVSIFHNKNLKRFIIKERDVGTTNGTFVNEELIIAGQTLQLQDGDLIQLARIGGNYRVVFRFRESEGTLAEYLGHSKQGLSKGLEVDLSARKVCIGSEEVILRKKEFDLLAFLYQCQGKVCSKDEIAQKVWKQEGGIVSQETIEQNISRIRKAIDLNPTQHRYIKTIHGGYRLDL